VSNRFWALVVHAWDRNSSGYSSDASSIPACKHSHVTLEYPSSECSGAIPAVNVVRTIGCFLAIADVLVVDSTSEYRAPSSAGFEPIAEEFHASDPYIARAQAGRYRTIPGPSSEQGTQVGVNRQLCFDHCKLQPRHFSARCTIVQSAVSGLHVVRL